MLCARSIIVFKFFLLLLIISTIVMLSIMFRNPPKPTLVIHSDEEHFNTTLKTLLIPRWVQSEGHMEVIWFITEELNRLGYTVVFNQSFEPFPLTNVIAVSSFMAKRFLLLSCHYDSKYLRSMEDFVSATDAGISCAILINMAKTLTTLTDIELLKRQDIGLILVFFDGHESLGGIFMDFHPLLGSEHFVKTELYLLKRINEVITLNLIGAPNQTYLSKYERTFTMHEQMADIEEELRDSGQLQKCHKLFHKLKAHESDIDDDHYSFLEKGLPVMHIVPHTYPDVWFQSLDNIDNMHWPTARNMNSILTRFVYEYFKHYNNSKN